MRARLAPALLLLLAALPARAEILKGPYLTNISAGGVTVLFETSEPGQATVRYGLDGASLDQEAYDDRSETLHEVRLTGLEPARLYAYEVEATTGESASGPGYFFQTAVPPHEPFRCAAPARMGHQPVPC